MNERKDAKTQKSQSQRQQFIETAKKLEVDESGEAFERAFEKIVPSTKRVVKEE